MEVLRMIKAQRVEKEVGYPRYLIGATGQGARSVRLEPRNPLSLSDLIFLHGDEDVRVWFLANQQDGKEPLDLMVLESRQGEGEEEGDQTPEPAGGRYPFFDRNVWDRYPLAQGTWGAMQEEEADSEDERPEDEDEDEDMTPQGIRDTVVVFDRTVV
jgi:hypothetical protein